MRLSKRKKKALCEFHDYRCEDCKAKGDYRKYDLGDLQVHQINPGLGYKDHRNLKILCKKHHEFYSSAQRIAEGTQGRN